MVFLYPEINPINNDNPMFYLSNIFLTSALKNMKLYENTQNQA